MKYEYPTHFKPCSELVIACWKRIFANLVARRALTSRNAQVLDGSLLQWNNRDLLLSSSTSSSMRALAIESNGNRSSTVHLVSQANAGAVIN
jgi:hypothetical protein